MALYFRDDAALIGRPGVRGPAAEPPSGPAHEAIRERLTAAPCFFTDLLAGLSAFVPEELADALWDLAWTGEVTNDAFAPLRAPKLTLARERRAHDARTRPGRRFGARRGAAAPTVQGRWSLAAPLFLPAPEPGERRRVLAELLLERYGILTREQVLAEGIPGGFATLYDALGDLETLGVCRRGYFVEGLGGAQFALPGAVERLRTQRAPEAPGETTPLVLAATDPAQPYGAALRWPVRPGEEADDAPARRPQRVAGAYVVLVGAEPVLHVERGGRGLRTLTDAHDPRVTTALDALASFVVGGRAKLRLAVERVDGEPVVGSDWEPLLVAAGFRQGPRRLTLSA